MNRLIEKIYYKTNLITDKMLSSKKEKTEPEGWFRKNIFQFITIVISILTFYWGILTYFYSELHIDKRKYLNAYYDEKHKVLKDLAGTLAKINAFLVFKGPRSFVKADRDTMAERFVIFNYARMVLNESNASDKIILEKLNECQLLLVKRLNNIKGFYDEDIQLNSDTIVNELRKIWTYENKTINSFDFSPWPWNWEYNKKPVN